MWVFVLIGFIVALIAVPFILERMRAEPDETLAPGKFADLPSGRTHYRWLGPVRGPVVVCIHGLTTPSPVWQEIADGLGATAFRVLVYDLYGRGFSQSVPGRQDAAFFVRQLEELLAHLGETEDVSLMGYSMGGAIAAAYAAKHPEQMQRVVFVAPSGIEETVLDGSDWSLKPWIGDWMHRVIEPRRVRAVHVEEGAIGEVQRQEWARRGFFPSVLSSRRGILTQRMEAEHRLIAREGIPVLGVWGEKDDVIPLRGLGTLAQWNREARQEVVAGAGHGLPYTHGDEVVGLLKEMLRE